jgi:hypothetical protein
MTTSGVTVFERPHDPSQVIALNSRDRLDPVGVEL